MSAAIAALIAHSVFWGLMLLGVASRELGPRSAVVIFGLWLIGFFGLSYVSQGDAIFPSYVAVLDVVLVLMIFKQDVPLS